MALTKISTAGVKDDAVTAGKIPADAVGSSEIAANAVGSSELADNAVDTAAIAADAVTGAKIADDAINSEHYTDGSIDTAHIADSQVTTAKVADDAVTAAKLASNAVVNASVDASAAIAGTKISPDFGSQNIVTTGTVGTGVLTVADASGSDPTMQINHSDADVTGEFIRVGRTDLPAIRYHSIKAKHSGSAAGNTLSFNIHDASSTTSQTEVLTLLGDKKVGIGTASPSYTSHFVGANETTFDRVGTIGLQGTDAYDSGNAGAGITFNGKFNSSDNVTTLAQISGIKENTTNGEYDGALTFGVRNDALGVGIERMRLTSAGNIRLPFINGSTGLRQKIQWVTEANYFDEVGYIAMNRTAVSSAPSDMVFATGTAGSTSERMRILSGGGITFNGDTAEVNALDDYEEGLWTPTVVAGTPVPSISDMKRASYVKIGRLVTVSAYFVMANTSSNTDSLRVGGLPFTVRGSNRYFYGVARVGSMDPAPIVQINSNATDLSIYAHSGSSAIWNNAINTYVIFSATYESS